MRRISKAAIAAAAVCSLGVSVAHAANEGHKVLLCHATSSAGNPYELISIDVHGAEGHLSAGHGDAQHTDFLLPQGATDCVDEPEE